MSKVKGNIKVNKHLYIIPPNMLFWHDSDKSIVFILQQHLIHILTFGDLKYETHGILDLFTLLFTSVYCWNKVWMIDPYHLMRSTMYIDTFMGTVIHQTFFPSVPFPVYPGLVHRLENYKCITSSLPQLQVVYITFDWFLSLCVINNSYIATSLYSWTW